MILRPSSSLGPRGSKKMGAEVVPGTRSEGTGRAQNSRPSFTGGGKGEDSKIESR